jgi:PAS domain S-box-containing protein
MRRLPHHRLSGLRRYGLVTLIMLAAAVLRMALPVIGLPYLFFIPPVGATAFLLGAGPGLFGTALASMLAVLLFIPPFFTFQVSADQWVATALFTLVTCGIVLVCASLRRVMDARGDALDAMRDAYAEAAASRAEAAAHAAFLDGVLRSSADCIVVLDLEARMIFVSEGGLRSLDVSDPGALLGTPWPDLWQGDARAQASAAVADARAGRSHRFQGQSRSMRGRSLWWDVAVTPMQGQEGPPERLLCVARDVSAHRRLEEQQVLLNQELNHRLKNTLAMAQAVMNQTLRQATSLPQAREALETRLMALGRAHGSLLDRERQGAEIHEVVARALLPHGGDTELFRIEGSPLRLSSRCALALTLALHELATNAVKYGALSAEGGRVALVWRILPPFDGAEPGFELTWRESGGPLVQPPQRSGFGSFMIKRTLPGYFEGTASLDYAPEGLVYHLEGSLAALNDGETAQDEARG